MYVKTDLTEIAKYVKIVRLNITLHCECDQ